MIKDELLSTKMIEKNNICLTVSLYSHTMNDGKVFFSFFGDYLGFGMEIPDAMDYQSDKFGKILSGKLDIMKPSALSYNTQIIIRELLMKYLDNLNFETVFNIIWQEK